MPTRAFRHLPALPGRQPSGEESAVYEATRAHLERSSGPLPRFLSLPGAAVAVVEDSRGPDGTPCVGLSVELARR